MQIVLSIHQESYRQHAQEQEAEAADLARVLETDLVRVLRPSLRAAAEKILAGEILRMDGAAFHLSAHDQYADDAWRDLYVALVEGLEIPEPADPAYAPRVLHEISDDLACGWLMPDAIRAQLPQLRQIAQTHRCLELYDSIFEALQSCTKPI